MTSQDDITNQAESPADTEGDGRTPPSFSYRGSHHVGEPLSTRMTLLPALVRYAVFANPALATTWDFVTTVVIVVVATHPLRDGHGFWVQLGIVLPFTVLLMTYGFGLVRFSKSKAWQWLLLGRTAFGELGGPRVRFLEYVHASYRTIGIQFEPEPEALLRRIGQHDLGELERSLRQRFLELGWNEEDWAATWQDVLSSSASGQTVGQIIASGRWSIFALRCALEIKFLTPLLTLVAGGYFWLLVGVASGRGPTGLLELCLLSGVVLGFFVSQGYPRSFQRFTFVAELPPVLRSDPKPATARSVDPDLKRDLEAASRLPLIHPAITLSRGYQRPARRFFSRTILMITVMNAMTLLVALAGVLPFAALYGHEQSGLVHWYVGMAVGTVLLPVCLAVSLFLAFNVFSAMTLTIATVFTTACLTLIPLAADLWLHGSLSGALAAGLSGGLLFLITEAVRAKEQPGHGAD